MLDYGGDCKVPGVRFTYPLGCKEALVTATPKEAEPCAAPNCDAPDHGYDIEWGIGQGCGDGHDLPAGQCRKVVSSGCVFFKASADAGPFYVDENGARGFNKRFVPQSLGDNMVWVFLHEPQGTFCQNRNVSIKREVRPPSRVPSR
jgi:hypothetical protein